MTLSDTGAGNGGHPDHQLGQRARFLRHGPLLFSFSFAFKLSDGEWTFNLDGQGQSLNLGPYDAEFEFQQANDWTEVFPDVYEARPIHAPKPIATGKRQFQQSQSHAP